MYLKSFFSALIMPVCLLGVAQQKDSLSLQKLEEVTVTETRFPLKRSQSGKVVFRTTADELKKQPGRNLADVLDQVAGIEINGSTSHPGQNLGYSVRGSRNRQVLILIDGVQVTDPSSIANDFDLRLLNTDMVEHLEVLKGASATLYGSGAAAAVINISLKKPEKTPLAGSATWAFGSNQSQTDHNYRIDEIYNAYSVSGTAGKWNYLAALQFTNLEGLSAINTDKDKPDDFDRLNTLARIGYAFNENLNISLFGNFDRFKTDFDESFGLLDADFNSESDNYRTGLNAVWQLGKHSLQLNAAYQTVDRDIDSNFPGRFNAESWVGDVFGKFVITDHFYLVTGVNAQRNNMESASIPFGQNNFTRNIESDDAYFSIVDVYANAVYLSPLGWQVSAGGRINEHSLYGSHGVFNLNPSYTLQFNEQYFKVLTSYSSAFITPSLFQLFAPDFGNENLDPERNFTFEGGLEWGIGDKHLFNVVYFNRTEKDFIDFVTVNPETFESQYQNVPGTFTAEGVEVTFKSKLFKDFNFSGNYSHTDRKRDLRIRIPANKVNLSVAYQLVDKTSFSLNYQYTDERRDVFFSPETFRSEDRFLQSYQLVDFFVSHQLTSRFRLFGSLTNLLNEKYQEVFGFTTRGANYRMGLEMRF